MIDRQQSTTPIALSGQVQVNRGGHPYVVVYEDDPALQALEMLDGSGKGMVGGMSPSGPRRFRSPVTILVGGVEQTATGIGGFFYDSETTRERNPRNGKVRVTTSRVEGSGRRYVYLQEQQPAAVASGPVGGGDLLDGLTPDEREHWGDFHSAARESRREDY